MQRRIEALVLGVTISVALFVLFAGIARVRHVVNEVKCHQNLKQMVLGMHNYASANTYLPSATIPNPKLPPEKRHSWLAQLVPFMESTDLFRRINIETAWDADENRFAAVDEFYRGCPSFPNRRPTTTLAITHYVGIAGIGADAASLPKEDRRAGLFGYDRRVRLEDLAPGTDSLMVIAETSHENGCWMAGGYPTARGLVDDGPPIWGRGGQFGGLHHTAGIVAMANGATRKFSASINPDLLKRMASLHDRHGVAVPEPE